MTKSRDDEIYERGVHEGQNAGFLDRFAESLTPKTSREDDIRYSGYVYGLENKPQEDRKDSEEKSNDDSVDIDDDDSSSSSSSSDSSYGDYSYSSSDDSGSYSSPSSSSSQSSQKKKEEEAELHANTLLGMIVLTPIVAAGILISSFVNSRRDISAPPVTQQIRQSYHESMYFRSDAGLKPIAPDQAYQGQGSIELHYPLSRTDKGLEAIVIIPAEDVELRDIKYWGGKIHYQEWRGKIGKEFDTNEDKFLSYDELVGMYDTIGGELVNLLYQDKVFVHDKNVEGGGPHAAPRFYQDAQERAANKSKLEEIKEDTHKIGKRVLNVYKSKNP